MTHALEDCYYGYILGLNRLRVSLILSRRGRMFGFLLTGYGMFDAFALPFQVHSHHDDATLNLDRGRQPCPDMICYRQLGSVARALQ